MTNRLLEGKQSKPLGTYRPLIQFVYVSLFIANEITNKLLISVERN